LVSGRLFEALGLISGLILIDYGFNFVATGFAGARQFTSEFVGTSLVVGGSAIAFVSLFYLLKPAAQVPKTTPAEVSVARPDIGVELVVEEATPPKSGFYRNIEYIGYFFAFLGIISAADLVLQVFIRSTYNELRWWVEVLLVTFGVLSYTIFGSIGRLGAQEEARLTGPPVQPKLGPEPQPVQSATPQSPGASPAPPSSPQADTLNLNLAEFTKSTTGDYEHHISETAFDMFRVDRDLITVWREDRTGMRSAYLAGPYELNRKLLEDQVRNGVDLKIGNLTLSVDTMRGLLNLEHSSAQSPAQTTG